VQRLAMMITPDGEWVLPGSSEFLDKLGDPLPDYDAEGFAVRNLGFIRFSMIERTIVEIELHPRNVALPALLAVQQQIQSVGVGLFRIKYLETTWQSEITSSAEKAMVRLSQLTAPAFVPQSRDRFIVEPRDYSQLLMDETNELRFMAQKWRMSFGEFDANLIPFAINHHLLQQMMIVGVRSAPAEPVFRFVGDGHIHWFGSANQFTALGERLVNFPDRDYGAWVAEYYKSVARTGQPRYDHVSATIQRPTGLYRTRYERLMLPWSASSDEVLVTMFSKRLRDAPELVKYDESPSRLSNTSIKSA
jgi:hypothetical protein